MRERTWHLSSFPDEHVWPISIDYAGIVLSPFRVRDVPDVSRLRQDSFSWLRPWEPTPPYPRESQISARERVRHMWREAREGMTIPWLIRLSAQSGHGQVVGQCTVSSIIYGSAQMASIGYWIGRWHAGRGIVPLAVAMATDYAMKTMGIHRVEICIRPENSPSLRVVEKLGFREEGLRSRFIHIDGDWRDHRVFALTREEIPSGLLARVPMPHEPGSR